MTLERLHLVTHAEATHHVDGLVGGWFDSELTPRGREQADRIAAVLEERIGHWPVRVHSSDLARAQQTAAPIADRLGVEVLPDARLRERSFGEAEGRPQQWLRERVIPVPEGADLLTHHDGPAGVETRLQLAQRLFAALHEILVEPCNHLVIVSHGSATSYLIMAWLGVPLEAVGRGFFRLDSGTITTLAPSPAHRSHTVLSVNEPLTSGPQGGGGER